MSNITEGRYLISHESNQEGQSRKQGPVFICRLLNIKPHPSFQGYDMLGLTPFDKWPLIIVTQNPLYEQDSIILNEWKMIIDYKKGKVLLFIRDFLILKT